MSIKRYELTEKERTPFVINAICKNGIKGAMRTPYGTYQHILKEPVEVVVNIARGSKVDDYYFLTMTKLRNTIDYAEIEFMKGKAEAQAKRISEESQYEDFLRQEDSIRNSVSRELSMKQKRDVLKKIAPNVNWSLRNTKMFMAGVKNMVWAFGKWRRI